MLIPRVGEQIGDFELIRRIGAGGMGVVYEARQLSTGRRVALKILSPAMTREKNRRRFLREAEAASRLSHPNIVGVYAIREDAELCYYAMELIEGWPLSRVRELLGVAGPTRLPIPELMRTHSDLNLEADPEAATVVEAGKDGPEAQAQNPPEPPLTKGGQEESASASKGGQDARPPSDRPLEEPPPQAPSLKPQAPSAKSAIRNPKSEISSRSIIGDESYVRQVVVMLCDIARALHYAHGQGVTHRDVKPDNLLLDHAGKLHLVDFGLARVMEEDNITLTGELMGTPLYMSPEQVAAGRIGIDHRTDIYSLGVVLYQLLCLQPPYEAPTREALLRAIVVQPPRPLASRNPAVPRELEAIVHHALEKDPDQRYASAGEMADDLDRWLAGQPISLRLPSRLEQWWGQLPRNTRRAIAGGLTAGLALAVGLAAIALHDRRPPTTTQPAGPAEAIEQAARAADEGNYLRSALWYSEALRRGAKDEQISTLQLAGIYDQLTPLKWRTALADGQHSWSLHPTVAQCALADPLGHLRVWDLAGDPAAAMSFGPESPVRWLSYDDSGAGIWTIEPRADGDWLQLWRPSGEAVASAPVKADGHIVGLRTVSGPNGYTVAVLTPAKTRRPGAAPADRFFDAALYRLQPGRPPALLKTLPGIRLLELSRDGRYLAVLTADEVLGIGYLDSQARSETPVGVAGSTALFVFSPARQELALASTSGAISLKDPTDDSSARRMELDLSPTGLRALTAPAYLRFSPNGKYLLVVGSDAQSTPPYLRSVVVVDTTTTKRLYEQFGWEAYFSDDSRTLVWWDSDSVTLVNCDESQLTDRIDIPMRVLARNEAPRDPAAASMSEMPPLPVRTDDPARRMLCVEAADPAAGANTDLRLSAWDTQTGERLGVLRESPDLTAFALDPTGRFALIQAGTEHPELLTWDLGGADEVYPRCTRLPALPASRDDIRVTRAPLVAAMSREGGRAGWSLTDPATLRQTGTVIPAQGVFARWSISDDATVLLQIATDRLSAWSFREGSLIQNMLVPNASENVLGLSPNGQILAVLAPDGGLELRDLLTGATAVRLGLADKRPVQARFSPSGRHLAVATAAPGRVVVCTPEANAPTRELDTGAAVGQMEFCSDDAMLVVGHTGGRASLWSISDGRRVAVIEPAGPASQGPGFSPVTLPTRIAVRDQPVGDAPPLLATAYENRIEIRPLPRPGQTNPPVRPLSLETTQGIVALAFPPCENGVESEPAETRPASAGGTAPRPCERLLVITERAAVRWFDLSVRKCPPQEWRELIAERTGMPLGPYGRPAPNPHP